MKKIRQTKRRVNTPKQAKNVADRMSISTNVREELVTALDNKVSGFRNIRWIKMVRTK